MSAAQLHQEFLESIAREYLNKSSREVYRVFLVKFAYDNQFKQHHELAEVLGKETVTFNKQLSAVYEAFTKQNGGPLNGRVAGKQQSVELFRWLWGDRFPEWLSQRGIVRQQVDAIQDDRSSGWTTPDALNEPNVQLTIEVEKTKNIGLGISKVKKKLVLDIDKINSQQRQAIEQLLQMITGDDSLKISNIEKGSVVLVLEGSVEGLERLERMVKSGELTQLLGIRVKEIRDATFEKSANLSQWLEGIFEIGWQRREELLTSEQFSLVWEAKDGSLDGDRPSRAKQINLTTDSLSPAIILLVNLTQETEETVIIQLRVYPTGETSYLPENFKLQVLVEEEEVFQEVTARSADEWMQVQFDADLGDEFRVRLILGEMTVTEDFII